jgi:hypothetical protein
VDTTLLLLKKRAQRTICGPETERERESNMRLEKVSFITCTLHQILVRQRELSTWKDNILMDLENIECKGVD